MKAMFHFLKKDLCQHRSLLGVFFTFLLCEVVGFSSDSFRGVTSPWFYLLMSYLSVSIYFIFILICLNLGRSDSPQNKDNFLATRPFSTRSIWGAKVTFVGMVYLSLLLSDICIAHFWGLSGYPIYHDLINYKLLLGLGALFFGAVWETLPSMLIGCLLSALAFFIGLLSVFLAESYGIILYDLSASALALGLLVGAFLSFIITYKLQRPVYVILLPLVSVITFLTFITAGCLIPPALTTAPVGSLDLALSGVLEPTIQIYGTGNENETAVRVLTYGAAAVDANYELSPMLESLDVTQSGKTIFQANEKWSNDQGTGRTSSDRTANLIQKFLRPEQVAYIDSKYTPSRFKDLQPEFDHLETIQLPTELSADDLSYRFGLSYKISEFRKVASLPLEVGAAVDLNTSRVEIIKVENFSLKNPGYGKIWLIVESRSFRQENVLPNTYVFNSVSDAAAEMCHGNHKTIESMGLLQRNLVRLELYRDPIKDTLERPEDRRIDIYDWVYLGVEAYQSVQITKTVRELFYQSPKSGMTQTYPVRHSTQSVSVYRQN